MPRCFMKVRLPTATSSRSFTSWHATCLSSAITGNCPRTPLPKISSKPCAELSGSARSCAASTTARARICVESCSTEAAKRRSVFSSYSVGMRRISWPSSSTASTRCPSCSARTMAVTLGLPSVSVPVLSKTAISTSPSCSMAAPLLAIMPLRAARSMPDIMAIGVARISGQGVATTMTASA